MSQRNEIGQASSRREFNQTLAALAAASLSPVMAKTEAQEPSRARPDPRAGTAEALTQIVRSRYGEYLSDEQMKEVRRSLERSQAGAARLKQFKLQNGDEPAFIFSADCP
jgi:Protein of unknown function (DUF4089)